TTSHAGTTSNNPSQQMGYAEMDAHHGEGIKIFLDNIGKNETFWHRPLEHTMDGDVKVFELEAQEIDWETEVGVTYPAFAYNGRARGPEIRVQEGEKVRIHVNNERNESRAAPWQGLRLPISMDGVPFITQDPIIPGSTFTYEFEIRN